jgi:perosamine synthetase
LSHFDASPARREPTYHVAGPWISDLEEKYVADAVRDGWYENAGRWPAAFESGFCAAVGREHAFSLPSCTAGLHLVLAALGIGPGDEVVVTEATWIASSAPISYVGAIPVFVDIDPISWCMSASSLEQAINERTKAAIVVDLYGGMPDWAALRRVADRAGVPLIEDAAQAVGSTWRGRPAGSFGVASVFSFHGSKTVTTGEGGMLLVDDDALAARIAVLRDHGRAPGDKLFQNEEVAFKYKMSPVQAALGVAQLERVDELVAKKRQIFAWYQERLGHVREITLNAEPEHTQNSYWMVTAVIDGVDKSWLADELRATGIDSRPFFEPLSGLPAYADLPSAAYAREANPVIRSISPYGINLPSALRLGEADIDVICATLLDVLGGC